MAQVTVSKRNLLVGGLAVAVAGLGTALGVTLATQPATCQPDPAEAIAALPSGATWTGSGCYTTEGITVTKPVTINGGTFNDPDVLNTSAPFNPIISVKKTSNVTIENVTLTGTNTNGGYHGDPYVGEEGIKVVASSDVTLDNVATNDTFGDGLILAFAPRQSPNVSVNVDHYTVTNAGRQGVTVAHAYNSTLDNLNVVSAADTGVDFESDVVGVGSGNVTVNNLDAQQGGVWFQEPLQAPITFNDATVQGKIVDRSQAAVSGTEVDFDGGTLVANRTIHGVPPGAIWIKGPGKLTLTAMPITRKPGKGTVTGLAWVVVDGGTLVLNQSPVTPPLGGHDATSTVTINP